MIKFYFHPSPNPLKIALYLEETGNRNASKGSQLPRCKST